MTALPHYGADPQVLRLCSLVRSVLRREGPFETMADLKDACAWAIGTMNRRNPGQPWRYEGWELDRAFGILGASQPLVGRIAPQRQAVQPEPATSPPISGAEARALLKEWKAQIRGMTAQAGSDPAHTARVHQQREQLRPADVDERAAAAAARIAWERTQGAT